MAKMACSAHALH